MKRILGVALLFMLSSVALMAGGKRSAAPRKVRSDMEHNLWIAGAVDHQDGRQEDSHSTCPHG